MIRKFIVGGNWKMNGNREQITGIVDTLKKGNIDEKKVDVVIGVPSIYLEYVRSIAPSTVHVAAQNCYALPSGAFTGEISAPMLKDICVNWVILGHSERRHVFGEHDELIGAKVRHAQEFGMHVIACVGETQSERLACKTEDVVCEQMKAIAANVTDWDRMVIAYEPVWAIGTGLTATPEQAQQVHQMLRTWVSSRVDCIVSKRLRIQYGGSVTSANACDLAAMPDIDGFLVGGASLKPEFIDIINARQ